ncbi:hypothetical protein HHI36_018492 [Cryptolaemus montrouzieri]|uniref:FYVE-type domain-containing protein n=1 Tax=Cryptolaemus montrouzieri TaxID=559131 RepID=A0ABD2P098_9CUCU
MDLFISLYNTPRCNQQLHAKSTGTSEVINCGKCEKKFIKTEYKILFCGPCKKWICEQCIFLKREQIKVIVETDSSWRCQKCLKNMRNQLSLVMKMAREVETDPENDESAIADVIEEMRKNHNALTNSMEKFRSEIQKSLQFLCDSFGEMKKLDENRREMNKANKQIQNLEESLEQLKQEKR